MKNAIDPVDEVPPQKTALAEARTDVA